MRSRVRRAILRNLEWLEDRSLLSGGLPAYTSAGANPGSQSESDSYRSSAAPDPSQSAYSGAYANTDRTDETTSTTDGVKTPYREVDGSGNHSPASAMSIENAGHATISLVIFQQSSASGSPPPVFTHVEGLVQGHTPMQPIPMATISASVESGAVAVAPSTGAHFRVAETVDAPIVPPTPPPPSFPAAVGLTVASVPSTPDPAVKPPPESIGVDPELETSRLDGNLCVLRDKIADFLTQILSSDDGPDGTSLLERLTPYAMVAGSAAFGLAYARRHRNRQRLLAGEIGMSDDDPSWDRRPDLVFLPMVPHP